LRPVLIVAVIAQDGIEWHDQALGVLPVLEQFLPRRIGHPVLKFNVEIITQQQHGIEFSSRA